MKAATDKSVEHAQRTSPLLSVEEAADYLGMSVQWCYRNLKRHIAYRKLGGALKFHIDDLNEFIKRSTHPPIGFNVRDVKSSVSLRELLHGNRLRSQE
jgi:excisionase family DNA binding protein